MALSPNNLAKAMDPLGACKTAALEKNQSFGVLNRLPEMNQWGESEYTT
jgi:hypothetical protein